MKRITASITFRDGVTRDQAVEALYAIVDVLHVDLMPYVQEGPNLRGLVAPSPEDLVGHLITEVGDSTESTS